MYSSLTAATTGTGSETGMQCIHNANRCDTDECGRRLAHSGQVWLGFSGGGDGLQLLLMTSLFECTTCIIFVAKIYTFIHAFSPCKILLSASAVHVLLFFSFLFFGAEERALQFS